MRVWFARRGPLASSTTLAPASCAAIAAPLPGALGPSPRPRERYPRDAVVVTDHNVARADYQAADLHRHVDRARRVFLRGARANAAAERHELFLAQQADVAHAAIAHEARNAPVTRLQRHVVAEGTGVVLAAFVDHQHITRLQHGKRFVRGDVVVGIVEDGERDADHANRLEYRTYLRHHYAVAAHGIRDGGRPDAFELREQLLRRPGKVVMNVAVHWFFPGS